MSSFGLCHIERALHMFSTYTSVDKQTNKTLAITNKARRANSPSVNTNITARSAVNRCLQVRRPSKCETGPNKQGSASSVGTSPFRHETNANRRAFPSHPIPSHRDDRQGKRRRRRKRTKWCVRRHCCDRDGFSI